MNRDSRYHWVNSMKFKLFLMILVVFTTPLILFGVYNNKIVKPNVENSIHKEHILSVTKISQSITKLINTIETSLKTVITTNYNIFQEEKEVEREDLMYGTLKALPYIEEVSLISKNGQLLSKFSRRYALDQSKIRDGKDPIDISIFKNNKMYIGRPKIDIDNQIVVELIVPAIGPEGDFIGGIIGVVNLRQVMKEITATDMLKGSYLMILDEQGSLIGHSDYSQVLRRQNVRSSLGVKKLIEDNKKFPFSNIPRPYETLVYTSYTGEEVLGVYGNIPEVDWGIVVEQPTLKAFEELDRINRKFNTYLISILVIVTLSLIVFGIKFIRPIEELSKGVNHIRDGHFDYVIPNSSSDEMGILIEGFNSMTKEIKKSKEQEKLLMLTEKKAAIGTLAAGVAHEINNPMNNLIFYATDLLDRIETEDVVELYEDGTLKLYLEMIKEQIERSSDITQNLLKFSRDSKVYIEAINLERIIEDVLKLMDYKLKKENIRVEFKVESKSSLAYGDDSQMRQVVLNIISNGVDAMAEGGLLIIRIYDLKNRVYISVRDYGIGIDEEDMKYIMDPFFTTKPLGKGTGLGLSISQAIVERMNGTISIRSKLNEGTEVIINLPGAGGEGDGSI